MLRNLSFVALSVLPLAACKSLQEQDQHAPRRTHEHNFGGVGCVVDIRPPRRVSATFAQPEKAKHELEFQIAGAMSNTFSLTDPSGKTFVSAKSTETVKFHYVEPAKVGEPG